MSAFNDESGDGAIEGPVSLLALRHENQDEDSMTLSADSRTLSTSSKSPHSSEVDQKHLRDDSSVVSETASSVNGSLDFEHERYSQMSERHSEGETISIASSRSDVLLNISSDHIISEPIAGLPYSLSQSTDFVASEPRKAPIQTPPISSTSPILSSLIQTSPAPTSIHPTETIQTKKNEIGMIHQHNNNQYERDLQPTFSQNGAENESRLSTPNPFFTADSAPELTLPTSTKIIDYQKINLDIDQQRGSKRVNEDATSFSSFAIPSTREPLVSLDDSMASNNNEYEDLSDSDGLVDYSNSEQLLGSEPAVESSSSLSSVQTHYPMFAKKYPLWFHTLMVLSISFIGFGSYAAYDSVSAIQDEIMADFKINATQFGLLFSIYALPNIVLVIFGGALVDRLGTHTIAAMTCSFIALGAVIVAIAPKLNFGDPYRFYIMIFGRLVFGIGAETSYVVQNSMCVQWYTGDYLATVMSITTTISRLGSVLSFLLSARINSGRHYTTALWAASFACMISLAFVAVYMLLRRYALYKDANSDFQHSSLEMQSIPDEEDPETLKLNFKSSSAQNSPRFNREEEEHGMSDLPTQLDMDSPLEVDQLQKKSTLSKIWALIKSTFSEIKGFSKLFWGCVGLGVATYAIVLSFRAASSEAIGKRYHYNPSQTGLLLAFVDITALITAPLIGWLIDWTWKLGWFTFAGNMLSCISFLLLVLPISPYYGVIFLGLSSTVVPAAIYPAVSFLTSPSLEGLAFGTMSAFINLVNIVFNPMVGFTLSYGWNYMCLVLGIASVLSVLLSLWWIWTDSKTENPTLNRENNWSQELNTFKKFLSKIKHCM